MRAAARAGLFASLILILAANKLRFEGFETEKVALLAIIGAVIVVSMVAEYLAKPATARLDWGLIRRSPLAWAAAALLISALISTFFSISPLRSLFGTDGRVHGLLALILYLILFWQAARFHPNLRTSLPHTLTIIALPLACLALWAKLGIDPTLSDVDRPAITAGQPNWLSTWLSMVILFLGLHTAWLIRTTPRPIARVQILQIGLSTLTVLLCMLVIVFATRSRGALLGLTAGIGVIGVLLAALTNHRRLLMGMMAVGLLAVAGYLGWFLVFSRTQNPVATDVPRLLIPVEPIRLEMWNIATDRLTSSPPLTDSAGQPDQAAALRPVIGFGPEVITQTAPQSSQRFMDRHHNLILDTLIQTGWVGLIALAAVYGTVFYSGMRKLGLLPDRAAVFKWLGLTLVGALLGIPISVALAVPVFIPILMALGALGGTLIWIALSALTRPAASYPITGEMVMIISIMGITAAHWVDHQFGFTTSVSQILWWVLLGLFIGLTQTNSADDPATQPDPHPITPLHVAGAAGLALLYSLGAYLNGASNFSAYGGLLTLFLTLLTTLAAGWLLSLIPPDPKATKRRTQKQPSGLPVVTLAVIAGIWLIYYFIRSQLVLIASLSLDQILVNPTSITSAYINGTALLFSIPALVCLLMVLFMLWQPRQLPPTAPLIALAVTLILAGALYIQTFSADFMFRIAEAIYRIPNPVSLQAAQLLFETSLERNPYNTSVRFTYLDYLLGLARGEVPEDLFPDEETFAAIEASKEILTRREPYIVNSREWVLFMELYNQLPD